MYTVLEIQTASDGTMAILRTDEHNINTAKQKYYAILSAASVSNVFKHTALILDDEGKTVLRECIFHRSAAQ